jgi:hypothetical protein
MKRPVLVMAMTALAGAGIAATADARGISAFAGRAADPTQQSCFTVNTSTGWVTNTCSATVPYIIALDTDSNGVKTINVAAEITESIGPISCHSVAVPRSGAPASLSLVKSLTQTSVVTNLQLGGSTVTTQGLLYVECDVGVDGSLIQVDWNN